MPPNLTLVQTKHFRARLKTKRGDYVYDSSRSVFTMPSGIELHVKRQVAWVMLTSTVRHLKETGQPYSYGVESLDDEENRKPCDS